MTEEEKGYEELYKKRDRVMKRDIRGMVGELSSVGKGV